MKTRHVREYFGGWPGFTHPPTPTNPPIWNIESWNRWRRRNNFTVRSPKFRFYTKRPFIWDTLMRNWIKNEEVTAFFRNLNPAFSVPKTHENHISAIWNSIFEQPFNTITNIWHIYQLGHSQTHPIPPSFKFPVMR